MMLLNLENCKRSHLVTVNRSTQRGDKPVEIGSLQRYATDAYQFGIAAPARSRYRQARGRGNGAPGLRARLCAWPGRARHDVVLLEAAVLLAASMNMVWPATRRRTILRRRK